MKITEHSITLDDGTVWPNPNRDSATMTDAQIRRHLERCTAAYLHLAAHPAGTERAIKTLRQLRRAAKVTL